MEINHHISFKKCRYCGIPKLATYQNFSPHNTTADKLSTGCKPCLAAKKKLNEAEKVYKFSNILSVSKCDKQPDESFEKYAQRWNREHPVVRSSIRAEHVQAARGL
jgi:hypothetical protein